MRTLRIGKRLAMSWILLSVSCALHDDRRIGVDGISNPDFAASNAPGDRPALPAENAEFLSLIQSHVAAREYWASETDLGLQAPNRDHDLRSYFDARGVRVEDRDARQRTPLVDLALVGLGRRASPSRVPAGEVVHVGKGRVEIRRAALGLVEWFENTSAGLEQGFTLKEKPAADETTEEGLVLELSVSGARASLVGDRIRLATSSGRSLDYAKLAVVDANDEILAARFEVPSNDRIRIVVDDRAATYPIVIDPVLTGTVDALLESDQANAQLSRVASAGDVNGDGYADVIVGAANYDAGQTDEGAAFVFLGSAVGIVDIDPDTAAAQLESNQAFASFGSVAGAGDVNGDGYDDVIVGAGTFDTPEEDEGAAFVFLGSASGIADGNPATAAAQLESNQDFSYFGVVAGAGDVNGDGYADIIVGASLYNAGQSSEGAAFVFLGSASGIADGSPATAAAQLESNWANAGINAVSGAGDVNGDGYADVIIGSSGYEAGQVDEGAAFVFHGSASGIADGNPATAAAQLESNQISGFLGNSVASAGDVNGDGYGDVIVGAYFYDAGQLDEGAAFVFLGSAAGVADGNPATASAQIESNQVDAKLGVGVAGVGDVNGDGYADVVVGANQYDAGHSNEGAAFVFLGNASGIADGSPTTATAQLESNQTNAWAGIQVAGAGDVNGDGYDDVIIGMQFYDAGQTDEGGAFVYHGGSGGIRSLTDATVDARLQASSLPLSEVPLFLRRIRVADAGDVNGDGYGDVILGAPAYDNGEPGEGGAFIFLGSAAGIANGSWLSAATRLEANQSGAELGSCVASAGDVNGDGFGDVIVGARLYDAPELEEGAAFVFLGSATGIANGGPATAHARFESNQAGAQLGRACGSAGDVNFDGHGDVIVGAPLYSKPETNEGVALVFLGSSIGVVHGDPANAAGVLESNQAGALLGSSAASAGDVDGDGYDDVIVGAPFYDPPFNPLFDVPLPDDGGAFVFRGSSTGVVSADIASAHARLVGGGWPSALNFGQIVASGGDIDGDGYDDIFVASPGNGSAYVYRGSSIGIPDGHASTAHVRLLGSASIASAGDVNGDGYGDLITGDALGAGSAFIYQGTSGGIQGGQTPPIENARITGPRVGLGVASAGDVNGDGQGDILVGSVGGTTTPTYDALLVLGNSSGRPVRTQQRRGDGSGIVVAPGGNSQASQFVAELFARSPRGREYGKLEVEYCPGANAVLGGPGCLRDLSPTWTDLGTTGSLLSRTISGLNQGTEYVWRARTRYARYRTTPPGAVVDGVAGPWFRLQARSRAADIRIGVPEPALLVALAVGGLALVGLAPRRRPGRGKLT